MSIVYQRPEVFTNEYMKYCGGCGHGNGGAYPLLDGLIKVSL